MTMTSAPARAGALQTIGRHRPGATLARAVHRLLWSPIAWLLLAALVLRLVLAYGLFLGSGYQSDIGSFTAWALTLAHVGPGTFYANASFADYPPGYLYVLWLIGSAATEVSSLLGGGSRSFGGHIYDLSRLVAGALSKLPAITADLLIGYLLYCIVRRWLGDHRGARSAALAAAALFLFNPVSWYDSAIWGQVDSVGTLVMLVAVILLIDGFSEAAVAAGVLASLIKPQYGIVMVPLIAVILLRRHLFAPGSGPRATLAPRVLLGWVRDQQGPRRLLSSAVVGAVVVTVLITPFSLDVPSLIGRMGTTAAAYPDLSVEAYNPWALVGSGGQLSLAEGGPRSSDLIPLVGPVTGFEIGAVLLAGAVLLSALQLALDDSRRSILLTVVFLSLAFFLLPTRVHERYVYPVIAFMPLLAIRSRSFLVTTVVMTVAAMINLHGVLTAPGSGTADLVNLPFGAAFRTEGWVVASAFLQTVAFTYVIWRLRPAVDVVIGPLRRLARLPPRGHEVDQFAARLQDQADP